MKIGQACYNLKSKDTEEDIVLQDLFSEPIASKPFVQEHSHFDCACKPTDIAMEQIVRRVIRLRVSEGKKPSLRKVGRRKQRQISDWIEKGLRHPKVKEWRVGSYLNYHRETHLYYSTALGIALIGKTNDPRRAVKLFREEFHRHPRQNGDRDLGILLGLPEWYAETVQAIHNYGIAATEISRLLSLGKL